MAIPQQKLRELTFEILYTYDFHTGDPDALVEFIMDEHKISKKNVLESLHRAQHIHALRETLDKMISEVSLDYDIDRIHSIERNILRLALYDLFIDKKLPDKVVIAEAKRLARKFSSTEGASFVHGLLDALLKLRGDDATVAISTK